MTLTMNTHAAFVNVQQMKYVIGSGKLYVWNNMQKKYLKKLYKCAFYQFNYTYTYINKVVIFTFSDKIYSQVIKWKTK
jgi:hypothetical protein